MVGSPYKLQLTKGFFVDMSQIARMLAYAVDHQGEGRIPAEALVKSMGVSASRVENLCSLATAFELIRPVVLTPTGLGLIVHRYDPFFDDLATLWLFHYLVSSNERYVVWNRLIDQVVPDNKAFSTVIGRPHFEDLSQHYSEHSMDKHLRKEMGAVWNAYTEQSFQYLGFIRAESDQIYTLGDPEPVPPSVFHAATMVYRERHAPGAATLEINSIARAANSPGRLFCLTERQVRDLLDEIKGMGYIFVETRADLDQIRFRDDSDLPGIMRRYYEER